MKIKETIYDELNANTTSIRGWVDFKFKQSELPSLFLEIYNYIELLNNRYPSFQLSFDFEWYYTHARLLWKRPLDDKEKLTVKELMKEDKEKCKKMELREAKRLAKKFKLIK